MKKMLQPNYDQCSTQENGSDSLGFVPTFNPTFVSRQEMQENDGLIHSIEQKQADWQHQLQKSSCQNQRPIKLNFDEKCLEHGTTTSPAEQSLAHCRCLNFSAFCSQYQQTTETDALIHCFQKSLDTLTQNREISLRFDDMKKSFKMFKGDGHISIFSWLQYFQDQSEIFQLSPLEKFIYARRLMDDSAKSFIEHGSKAVNFDQLAKELILEYDESINSTKNMGSSERTDAKRDNRYGIDEIRNIEGRNKAPPSVDMIERAQPSVQMKRAATVFVEGNIGAGKSTLINSLAEYDFIQVHQEPVGKWQNLNDFNLLDMIYRDPNKYAFMFQSYVMLTMLQRHLTEFDKDKINVMERSVLSVKHCFIQASIENRTIEQPFAEVLQQWFNFAQSNFQIEPDLIVYLRTNPENLIRRIKQRGRKEEQNINVEFLQQLHQLHENWLQAMTNKLNILTIDADAKLNEETFQQILSFIKKAGGVGFE